MAEKNSLWKNIRANRGSGRKPTVEMLRQERKIKASKAEGGPVKRGFLEEKEFRKEYDKYADATGNASNPYDVEHYYNYSKLYDETGGIMPHLSEGHLPSEYKELGHPNLYIEGRNTKTFAEGGEDELPTYRYANKEGVIGGPAEVNGGTRLPVNSSGTPVVNLPEFEVISTPTSHYGTPNPYSPVTGEEFLNSNANPVNWFLPNAEQQRQPIDPKTGMPFPASGLATPVYPETEFIGIKKGKEAIDAFKHVDFSDMSINKSKSSIDWNKWSSDAADNPSVVKHLNEIEKKSKKSGTWMKDFDIKDSKVIFKDTPFKGTPEEFVVQQSDNFRKAFPNGVETMYTGSNRHIFDYANHDEWGKGSKAIFGTSSEANAGAYGWDDVNNKAKPNFNPQDPRLTYEGEMRNGDFEGGVHKLGFSKDIPFVTGEGGGRGWRLVDWNDNVAKGTKLRPRNNESLVKEHNDFLQDIYNNGDYLKRDYDIDGFNPNKEYLSTDLYANYITNPSNPEAVAKVNNTIDTMGKRYMLPQTTFALDPKRVPVKSMRHNIMFDMDNPNIYKSILPAIGTGVVGIGAVNKYYNNQQQAEGGYFPTQGPGKALFKGYAEGGPTKPIYISDPAKFKKREQAYKDSSDVYNAVQFLNKNIPTATNALMTSNTWEDPIVKKSEVISNRTGINPTKTGKRIPQAYSVNTGSKDYYDQLYLKKPTPVAYKPNPIAVENPHSIINTERLEPLGFTNINQEEALNLRAFPKQSAYINRGANSGFDANGNPLVSEYNLGKGQGWIKSTPEELNQFEEIKANGGYTNPYNMYQDDPYLQYKVGGQVLQGIGEIGYGIGEIGLNAVTFGATKGILDKGHDAFQKAANPNFDPNNPNDVKALNNLGKARAVGQGIGAVGTALTGNVAGAAAAAGQAANTYVQTTDASDDIKKGVGAISGIGSLGYGMGKIGSGPEGMETLNKIAPMANQAIGSIGGESLMQQGQQRQAFINSPEYLAQETASNQAYANQGLRFETGGNITNNSLNLRNTMRYKRFAKGGTLEQQGINFITEDAGLHHQSAKGGVPIGPGALAEGGEAKLQMADGGQYIVSGEVDGANTQSINGETMTERLKKRLKPFMMGGLASNPRDKEELKRPHDSYSAEAIAQVRDASIQETENLKMQRGGAVQYAANGGKLTKDIEKIVMEEYAAAYGGTLPNKYKGKVNMPNSYAKGGIHINPENKGKFTASAKAAGHSVQEHARAVLNNPNATPLQKKRANFARNAAKWKHSDGGYVHNQMTQPMLAEGGPIYGDPASEYTYAYGGMYGDPYARGGQIDYTNDMYSSYAGGGPMVSNVNQPFKGPAAQNRGGMYIYPDGGMMPPEQQMMQEQAPQEQMQEQGGGQEQMMQMVQQVEQMLQQGAQPEQVMQQLIQQFAQTGMPQEQAMQQAQQVVQMAMQEAQGQMQQQGQPMQGQEQQIAPQEMAHGGYIKYAKGGTTGGIPVKLTPTQEHFANQMYKRYGKVVLTDKATNETIYGTKKQDGTWDLNKFEVLTGANSTGHGTGIPLAGVEKLKGKAQEEQKKTPIGVWGLKKAPNIYGMPGYDVGNTDVAYHVTYKGEDDPNRAALYNNENLEDNYKSYGCINCEKPSMENLLKFVGDNGFSTIIDSRISPEENSKWMLKNTPSTHFKYDKPVTKEAAKVKTNVIPIKKNQPSSSQLFSILPQKVKENLVKGPTNKPKTTEIRKALAKNVAAPITAKREGMLAATRNQMPSVRQAVQQSPTQVESNQGYQGSSIVDYLASKGQDFSKEARAQLAAEHGIENYNYSAADNTKLLNILKNKKSYADGGMMYADGGPPYNTVNPFTPYAEPIVNNFEEPVTEREYRVRQNYLNNITLPTNNSVNNIPLRLTGFNTPNQSIQGPWQQGISGVAATPLNRLKTAEFNKNASYPELPNNQLGSYNDSNFGPMTQDESIMNRPQTPEFQDEIDYTRVPGQLENLQSKRVGPLTVNSSNKIIEGVDNSKPGLVPMDLSLPENEIKTPPSPGGSEGMSAADWGTMIGQLAGPASQFFQRKPKPFQYKKAEARTLDPTAAIALMSEESRRAQDTAGYGIRQQAPTSGSYLANIRANALQFGKQRGAGAAGIKNQYDAQNSDILNRIEQYNTDIENKGIDARQQDLANFQEQRTNALYNAGANIAGMRKDYKANDIDQLIANNIGTSNYKYDQATQTITYRNADGKIVTVPATTVVPNTSVNIGTGQPQQSSTPQFQNNFSSNLTKRFKGKFTGTN
jgi:hypothetical protein